MNPGRLNKRITIKQKPTTQDSFGHISTNKDNYIDFMSLWASIEPIRGKDFFSGKLEKSEITTKIMIRYYAGIKPDMIIVYGVKKYEIISIIDYFEQHTSLDIMCKEVL